MHMNAVADQLRSNFFRFQDGPRQAGCAMVDSRHAIEQVGGTSCARSDGRTRLLVSGRRVAKGHLMATRREPANQLEAAVQLRRERHDSNIGRRALDLTEDIADIALSSFGFFLVSLPSAITMRSCPRV